MRTKKTLRYRVGQRIVEVSAYDAVGPEDCYDILMRGAIHRIATGEDLVDPIPREVKDFIIRQNLVI